MVFKARRCQSCGRALDLPTVHFLCQHSFHQRCLNVNVNRISASTEDGSINVDEKTSLECPVCAPQNATIKAIRRRQIEAADQHDLFTRELGRSRDRFGTVSEFFGRGVMRQKVE